MTDLSYPFVASGGLSQWGTLASTSETYPSGDGPVPSTSSIFSGIANVISSIGQTIRDNRNPAPGQVSSTTAGTGVLQGSSMLMYGVIAIIGVLVVLAVFKK